jgi:hypothetical protein
MMMRAKQDRMTLGDGDACPQCGKTAELFTHTAAWRPKPGKGYMKNWNVCQNRQCETQTFPTNDPADWVPAHVEVETNRDADLADFLNAIECEVPDTKLVAMWVRSGTFKTQWKQPTNKSEASILFSCFHFGLTTTEATSVMFAWFCLHDRQPDNQGGFDDYEDEVVAPRYAQAEAQKQERLEGTNVTTGNAKQSPPSLDRLSEVIEIEELKFDAGRGKYLVSGVVR